MQFANDLALAAIGTRDDISTRPLKTICHRRAGLFTTKLEAAGVTFYLGAAAERVDRTGESFRLTLASGETIEADLVLSAVGLRPRTAIAKAAGIHVNRGIVVNRSLQTHHAGIYALGDCAEVEGRVLPFVMPITYLRRRGDRANLPPHSVSRNACARRDTGLPDHIRTTR